MFSAFKAQIKKRDKNKEKHNQTDPFDRNDHSVYVTKNKAFPAVKDKLVEYMISEETQFVDLKKCENYYRNLNFKLHSQTNQLCNNLTSKTAKLNQLESQIQQVKPQLKKELGSNIPLERDEFDVYYKEIIRSLDHQL